jgi:hypothetical protein
MSGIFSDNFLSLLSPLATAQYRPTPTATFPNPAAATPGPLAIPPATPPIFLSPPDPAGAAPAQSTSAFGGIGNALTNGISNIALTLIALGAGIAQGGVGKGLAAAATAAEAERNRQAQQLNLLQTYQALTDGGVPPQEAQAAIGNPSLMRALAAKFLGPRSPGNASSAPAALASAPVVPPNVPSGAAYSPSPTPASAANSPGPNIQDNATNVMPALASAPALPPNVTAGAAYSPTRNMWRDHAGNRFDLQGKAVP